MYDVDAISDMKRFNWTEWVIPGTASLLVHAGLVVSVLALYSNRIGTADIIKAQVLDIADSNSPREPLKPLSDRHGTREISNQEMVERLNLPMGLPRDLRCSVAIAVARDGRVLEAVVTRSTGNLKFDQSIVEAVYKSSPFPKPLADQPQAGVYRFELRLGEN